MNQTAEKPAVSRQEAAAQAHRFNLSVSPHVRSRLSTGWVMYDVLLSLLPVTVAGVYRYGVHALLIILVSVGTAVGAEALFDWICKRPLTVRDGSAAVTGLLLALCLPARVPLYIPYAGSLFAILVVKCFFGGLGKNFMNPALAGRCFLLISFSSAMSSFAVDGLSSATPLAQLAAGKTVSAVETFFNVNNGIIGGSVAALMVGGFFLWVTGGITFEIPVAAIASFTVFIGLFGGKGFDPLYLLLNLCGGGIVMGAVFMATDPVTSPVTRPGQLLYGALVGILSGLFRVRGSAADSVSYAILLSNMVVPLIDEFIIPKPFAFRSGAQEGHSKEKRGIPRPALTLCVITLVAGLGLSFVYRITKEPIEKQKMAANLASYQAVCPGADDFSYDPELKAAVEALGGEVYGSAFGKSFINEVVVGTSGGQTVGYVVSVTNGDAFDGTLTLSVGLAPDGTVNGIAFTELHETAGMGMVCGEDSFKGQFAGVKTDSFVLNKAGGSTADNEIDSVSGASRTSGAVVNAVNAALDFMKGVNGG